MCIKFKRSLVLFITIFTFVLVSINAAVQFNVTDGTNLNLYNERYELVDSLTPIDKNGYIVQTLDETVIISSEFAEVHISPNTVFAITDFSTANPSCYLIDGKVNLFILYPQEVKFNCYTPTSNFMISSVGEYVLSSLDDEENFYNFSEDPTDVYDSIREKTYTVSSYTYANLFTDETDLEVTKKMYKALSIFRDDVILVPQPISKLSVSVERYIPEIPAAPTSLTSSTEKFKLPEIPTFVKTVVTPFVEHIPEVPEMSVTVKKPIVSPATVYTKQKPKTNKAEVRVPAAPTFLKTDVVLNLEEILDIAQPIVEDTELKEIVPEIAIPKPPVFSKVIINEQMRKINVHIKPSDINFTTETEVAPTVVATEGQTGASAIKDSTSKKAPFSLYLTSSLTLDNKDGIIPVVALQQNIDTGTFKANFNIDVLNLFSFLNVEKTAKGYYRYATSFINQITYRTLNEKFALSLSRLDSTLEYDPVELFFREDRNYELTRSKLTLTHNLRSNYFNQSFIFDDLALNSDIIKANYTGTIKFSKKSDSGLKFGTNAIIRTDSGIKNSILFPFASLSASLFSTDNFSFGAEIGAATVVNFVDEYDINDSFVEVALPMNFYGANLTLGASYNFGYLAKGVYIDGNTRSNSKSLDINLKSSYKNGLASFRFNLLLPVDLDSVSLKKGEEYLDLALGLEKNNFRIQLGFKTFALFTEFKEAFKNNADLYTTLSYVDNNFETGLSLIRNNGTYNLKIFNTIKNFNYVNKEIVTKIDNRLFNFGLDLAYKAQVGKFGNISLIPFISVGRNDYQLALQFPVAVKLHDTIFSFESLDNTLYNFGSGLTNEYEKFFDIINDSTTFIKRLTLGNDMTPFHLYMDRDYSFNNTSNFVDFRKYSFKDHLTTILGTRFGQYGNLDLIVPNIAMPSIIASNITILPTGKLGDYDIEANLPVEFLIEKNGKCNISAFPFIKANIYLKNFGFNVYFTTMVNLNNNMQDRFMFNQFLFGKNERYTIGGSMNFRIGPSKFTLNGGAYKYRNDSEYFNPFYEMLGYSVKYESSTFAFTSLFDTQFKYFGLLGYNYTKDAHNLKLSYRVDNILAYADKDFASDIFNVDYAYNLNEVTKLSLGCYLSGVKQLFTNLDFESYLNSNKLLAYFNLNKAFNHYQIGIQLNVAPQVDASDKTYVNSFSTLNNSVISVSTYATLRY